MSDPIIPGVTLPAGAGVPEPFNANDALIWKTAICKYICKKEKGSFRRTDFLQTLVNGGIPQVGAYDKKEMEKAIHDNNNDFNNLIRYCLDSLHKNDLLKKADKKELQNSEDIEYRITARLEAFCPEILRYEMLDIETLIKAIAEGEEVIRNDKNSLAIINMLKTLKEGNQIELKEVSHNIEIGTLTKLNELGVILISFNNQITISAIGERVLVELLSH